MCWGSREIHLNQKVHTKWQAKVLLCARWWEDGDKVKPLCKEKYEYIKKKITDFELMHDIQWIISSEQIPVIDQNGPPLPFKNRRIPDKEHMPSKEKKRPKFPAYET